MTSGRLRQSTRFFPSAMCALAGICLFHFYGNANRGYLATDSLFVWWGAQWLDPASEMEHGWLILGLSGWLLLRNARRPGGADGAFGAAGWFAAALAVHVLGFLMQQARLSIVGLLLFFWAWLGMTGGRRWARAGLFPTAFMLLAVPAGFLDTAGFPLRLLVVRSAALLADGIGWPVLMQGTRLLSPDGAFHYEVDYACAGVRSLAAILAVSLFIGYVRLRPAWARAAVVLAALPLTYVANVLRLLAIVGAGRLWGQEAGAVVHDVGGYAVFLVVLGMVHWLCVRLDRLAPGGAADNDPGGAAGMEEAGRGVRAALADAARSQSVESRWRSAIAPLAGVLAAGVVLSLAGRHLPAARADVRLAVDPRDPAELPAFPPGEWIGRRAEIGEIERRILPPDTGFSRRLYTAPHAPGRAVLVSIVLSGRDRSSIHRPELCLVGQGWTIAEAGTYRFRYPGRTDAPFAATTLRLEQQGTTGGREQVPAQMAAYWFVGGGRIVRTHWERLFLDAWARLRGRPIRWAYVLAMTAAPAGEAEALGRIQQVLDGVLPAFQPPLKGD